MVKDRMPKSPFPPFNPFISTFPFTAYTCKTKGESNLRLTKHPQYRPHRARMHHLLPTPSLLRLCRRRRPLPNHLLLLLRPNPNHPRLPCHRHQRSHLRPLPYPDLDLPPPNIRLHLHWHRRPTRAISTSNDMEKVYGYPRLKKPRWTSQSPRPFAIPMPTLPYHHPPIPGCPARKPEPQRRPPLLCLREFRLLECHGTEQCRPALQRVGDVG